MNGPTISVVCTGNICRSPMAELLLQDALSRADRTAHVESAGLGALEGYPADPEAIRLLAERSLDLASHRARQLTGAMVSSSDLVLVMDSGHRRELLRRWPFAHGRVFLLGHAGGYDVPDPYKRGPEAFAEALRLIDRGINEWLPKLISLVPPAQVKKA